MAMQETGERANNRLPPALIELLINERNKGKSLRQLGQMVGKSHERIRQILAKYDWSHELLLPEARVVAKLGYPPEWLIQLRKQGITRPIRRSGWWLYSEEQVKQIPLLIAERRRCELCGKFRPLGCRRFCRECSRQRKKHWYETLSPEKKAEHVKRIAAWRKANPEKWKEIQARGRRQHQAKMQAQASIISSNRERSSNPKEDLMDKTRAVKTRAVINLKEGIIELEGPVDFVRHYLDMYQPAIKGLPEDISVSKAKRKVVPGTKAEKRPSCAGAIRTALEAGFFDEPRSSTEVRQRLSETGLNFTDTNIRTSLGRLAKSGSLGMTGRGRALRYHRPEQS